MTIDMDDGGACSAFVAKDENGQLIYARNYDYLQDSQNALVHTNPANTSVHVDVKITKKTGSSGGWWFWSKPSKTTWTAAITVTGEGVEIQKVEYSMDQKNYQTGTSFTSDTDMSGAFLNSLHIVKI